MENCGDKVRNEFIPDRNEFIPVNFFHSATMNCARQKPQWMDRTVLWNTGVAGEGAWPGAAGGSHDTRRHVT